MTAIEWTERTWNPVTGCDRTSPGCDNCYALTMAARLKRMGSARYQNDGNPRTSGPGFAVTCHPEALDEPSRRRKPTTYFVNSMSDLFHPDIPDQFIRDVWQAMAACSQHTFQVLTKRSKDMRNWVNTVWPDQLPNVWLGTSIESDRYTFRADHLRDTPAVVRFLSCEPLLGPLPSLDLTGIDWVIIGCESGPHMRPMLDDWARDIVAKARAAGTAVFVKQLHHYVGATTTKAGRRTVTKQLDEFPADLRIREYPAANPTTGDAPDA